MSSTQLFVIYQSILTCHEGHLELMGIFYSFNKFLQQKNPSRHSLLSFSMTILCINVVWNEGIFEEFIAKNWLVIIR